MPEDHSKDAAQISKLKSPEKGEKEITGLQGASRKIFVMQLSEKGDVSVMSGWCTLTSKLFLIRTLFYAKCAILWGRYLELCVYLDV